MTATRYIYLDNASTTSPKPPEVIEAVMFGLTGRYGSIGRSNVDEVQYESPVEEVRRQALKYFGGGDEYQVAFVPSATIGMNIVLRSLVKAGDHVVTTNCEHHAVYRPLEELKSNGVDYGIAEFMDGDCLEHPDSIIARLCERTKVVVITHGSNVIGTVHDVVRLGTILRGMGIKLVIDVSQTAGIEEVDLGKLVADVIVGGAHKHLYGPTGIGFIVFRSNIGLQPLYFGGTGRNSAIMTQPRILPEMLEVGTVNLPSLLGLRAAMKYCSLDRRSAYKRHEEQLVSYLLDQCRAITRIRVNARESGPRTGVVSLSVDGLDPNHVVAPYLAQHGIVVRSGLHCAPVIHKTMGTFPEGSVRVSVSAFTTIEEIEVLISVLRRLC